MVLYITKDECKMYPFEIVRQDDGGWLFGLNGINIIVKNYFVQNNNHYIASPETAIAFFRFNGEGNIYGLSNALNTQYTIEAFFNTIATQHSFFDATPITDGLLQLYGFTHIRNEWDLEIKLRNAGSAGMLRYVAGKGWYFNTTVLKSQPSNISDLMAAYVKLTGVALSQPADRYFS